MAKISRSEPERLERADTVELFRFSFIEKQSVP